MNNTEIKVVNLSDEFALRFGGNTWAVLDIPTEFSLRLSKSVEQLSVLNKISTEGVLGFTVPFSPTNDAIFSEYSTPLTLDNRKVYYNVQVQIEGHGINFNRLQVKGKNERSKEWELELNRTADHWVELASQVKTNELPLGSFIMSEGTITGYWDQPAYNGSVPIDGQQPIYFPLVDYGGWVDQRQPPQETNNRVKTVAVEDFRPWISFPYILRAGFCAINWTLESVLFDMDVIRRLWVYCLRSDYFIAGKRGSRIIGRQYDRIEWTAAGSPSTEYLRFTDLVQGLPGQFIPGPGGGRFLGIQNNTGADLKYRFYMKGQFHNDRSLFFESSFVVMELEPDGPFYSFTGEVFSSESLDQHFDPHQKIDITFDQVVTIPAGKIGAIHIPVLPTSGFFIEPGLYFQLTPANDCLMTDDIVNTAECVSDDMSILDWVKAFVQLVNGRMETDFETKTVTIYPNKTSNVFGQTAPGFLLRESPIVDIEDLVVKDSVQIRPVRPDLKRYTLFGFKQTTDAYISSLNLSQPAHSRKLLNSVDLPNQTESILNPFIEPTLEGRPEKLASGAGGRNPLPRIPRLWDNTNGERSFNLGVRILYAYDKAKQVNPSPIGSADVYTSFFFNTIPNPGGTGLVSEFGYASQLPTWELLPAQPVINLVFGQTSVDLFTVFYLGYTQDNRSGNIADVLLKMKMKDYVGYDFRQFFRFRYRGFPIVAPMISIRDFSSGESDVPTPVQFFIEPAETECCDLPCGCQFSTCEYYQDMGVRMRQSTLNTWKIESFVVDGIELIVSPVSLGLINIIDIGGKPYVTNLVDTLNSIGAAYFSFGYSTRSHPEKGKRFFTIKRLACIPFRIEVSVGGGDGYVYTQNSQAQAIFQSGFDDMGYGSEFYGTPENCLITTEY